MSLRAHIPQGFFPLSGLVPRMPPAEPVLPAEKIPGLSQLEEPSQPGVQLGEVREFRAGGKPYVFVASVTAIFGLDELGAELLQFLRPQSGTLAATAAIQVPASRHVSLREIFSTFRARYTRQQIVETLKELRGIGALRFLGFRDQGLQEPPPQLPPLPFPQRTLVLSVANDCNLGCSYCFAAQGDYGGPRRMMSQETARSSVDFLLANSGEHKTVTLVFFGGEPLMNLAEIKRLVAYANEAGRKAGKQVEFTMTTNATYLTPEVIGFLSDNAIGVSVSIDGPKKYHDLRRTYKDGHGSYDFIHPRILNLLRNHKTRQVAARATLTHGVTAVRECFWHLMEMGFHEAGFAPVTSAAQQDYALTPEELWDVLDEFRHLAGIYVQRALRNEYLGFSNLTNLLSELHAGYVKAYPCGAGLGLLGVGASGDLHLCHRFLESSEHRMGNVREGLDVEKQSEFLRHAHLSNKSGCQTCWVRHICSGGCHHEAYTRHGRMYEANSHYCEWIRTWINLGLECYVEIMDKNPGFIERYIEKRGAGRS